MTADELATVAAFAAKVADGTTVVVDELVTAGAFADLYAKYGLK